MNRPWLNVGTTIEMRGVILRGSCPAVPCEREELPAKSALLLDRDPVRLRLRGVIPATCAAFPDGGEPFCQLLRGFGIEEDRPRRILLAMHRQVGKETGLAANAGVLDNGAPSLEKRGL